MSQSFDVRFSQPAPQGGYHFRLSGFIKGHRVSSGRWRGRIVASATVLKGGAVYDRCLLGYDTWTALAPVADLQMASVGPDSIGNGLAYHYRALTTPVTIMGGSPTTVQITFGPWTLDFSSGGARRLHRGTYTHATRWPFNKGNPGIAIFGQGRGCNQDHGQFTITRLALGPVPFYQVRALSLSFTQHCDADVGALRGRLSYVLG